MAYLPESTPMPIEGDYAEMLRRKAAAQRAQQVLDLTGAQTPSVFAPGFPAQPDESIIRRGIPDKRIIDATSDWQKLQGQVDPGRTPFSQVIQNGPDSTASQFSSGDIGGLLASLPKRGEPSRGSSRVLGDMLVNRTEYAPGTWSDGPGTYGMVSKETSTPIDPQALAMRLRGSGSGPLSRFMPEAYKIHGDIMAGDRQRLLGEAQAEQLRGSTATAAAQEARLRDQLKFEQAMERLKALGMQAGTPEEKQKAKEALLQEVGIQPVPTAAPVAEKGLADRWSPGRQLWQKMSGARNAAEALEEQWGVDPNNPWTRIPTHALGNLSERAIDLASLYGLGRGAAAMGIPGAAKLMGMKAAAAPGTAAAPGVAAKAMSKLIGLFSRGRGAAQAAAQASPLSGMMTP